MDEKKLIAASTRIVYSTRNLSGQMQLRWSELLHYFFHNQLKALQINDHEVAAALKPFKAEKELVDFFSTLPPEEQLWIIASLKILLNYAEEINDFYAQKSLAAIIEQCEAVTLTVASEIAQSYQKQLSGFDEFKKRRFFTVPGSIILFSTDYFLRWALLIAYNYFAFDEGWVKGFNFFLIPLLIVLAGAYIQQKDRAYNEKLLQGYNYRSLFGFKFVYSTFQYTLLVGYLATGVIISAIVLENYDNQILYLILLVFYYYFLIQIFPTGRLSESYLENQLNKKSNLFFKDADENDERIVLIETQLNSSSGRLEAYVLESALFGALAFSAFLQIFATNLISFTDVEKFATNVNQLVNGIVLGNWDDFYKNLTNLNNKESLFSLISIETLICSGLFVAVIGSRLRFTQIADKLRTDLNLAKAYNEKEENILEANDQSILSGKRFVKINERIHQHLESAAKNILAIEPIVGYMIYFRNLGVFVFATVLITSCLFISTILAWSFLIVVVATWIYFNFKEISTRVSVIRLQSKIYFVKHSYSLLVASILLFVPCYLLKVFFGFAASGYCISFSFLLFTIYLFIKLVQSHYDEQFGEIELLGWSAVRNIFGLSILLYGAVIVLANFHWISVTSVLPDYASISTLVLSLVVPFYLTKPRWPGIVWSFSFFCSIFIFMFAINHVNVDASIFTGVSIFLWILFFIIYFRIKMFHKLFVRIAVVTLSLVIIMSSDFFGWKLRASLYERLELMYQHENINIDPLLKIKEGIHFKYFYKNKTTPPDTLAKSIAITEDYIKKYGKRYGETNIYRYAFSMYDKFASSILAKEKPDSISLQQAYAAVQEADKISEMFKYRPGITFKARILKKMGKKNEAIKYYENVLKITTDDGLKKSVRKSMEKMQKEK